MAALKRLLPSTISLWVCFQNELYRGSNSRQILFICYHGGVYDNRLDLTDATRQRQTSSKLIDCLFKARDTYSKKTKLWTLKGETVPDHNHEITKDSLLPIQQIDTMLDNQVTEINALIGKETMQITHRHSNPTIAVLTRKMLQHALDLFMATSWWNLKLPRMLKPQFATVT